VSVAADVLLVQRMAVQCCTSFKSAVLGGGVLQPHPITLIGTAWYCTAALGSCGWLRTAIPHSVVVRDDLQGCG
jgi:hypothetical protein